MADHPETTRRKAATESRIERRGKNKTLRALLAKSKMLGVGVTEPGTPTLARLVPPRPAPNRLHLRDASAPY